MTVETSQPDTTTTQLGAAMARATGYKLPKTTTPAPTPAPAPPKPAGNDLGASMRNSAPTETRPSIATVVKRFFSSLVFAADISALKEAAVLIKEQKQIEDEHSPVVADQKVRQLSEIYARDPSAENFEKLRHAKTLSTADHSLTQQFARLRIKEIMVGASPACRAVCVRAAEIMESEADGLRKHDEALSAAWDVMHVPSARLVGIREVAAELRGQTKSVVPFDGLPEVVIELLRAYEQSTLAPAPTTPTDETTESGDDAN